MMIKPTIESVFEKPPDYTLRERATIITQTPMRITLAGGGTDVLWYSQLRGGAWVSGAIDKYVFIFLNKNEDEKKLKIFEGGEVIETDNVEGIGNPIVHECFNLLKIKSGVEIATLSDASAKSGLGGSGAFEVGLLHALHAYKGEKVSKLQLAKEACYVEIDRLKKPVGPQDQYICALGGIRYFEIDRKGKVSSWPLKISRTTIEKLESNFLFFRTGIKHDTSSIHGESKKKIEKKDESSEELIQALDDIKALGQQAKRYLLTGKVDDFGATLHQHWLIKKRLSSQVTSSQIDEWYNEGIKAGALGGKIMGSGGGGWFVFYVNKNKARFRERMVKIGLDERRVRFDWEGTKLLVNLS